MNEKMTNTKNSKHKLYKVLSIVGLSTLTAAGLAGVIGAIVNVATTDNKNLGTDYGQGLNFNLQFSLNNPKYNGDSSSDGLNAMIASLQETANALSNKLYQLGLKQIRLTPRVAGYLPKKDESGNVTDASIINNDNIQDPSLKNVYGVIDVDVDSQQGTIWHLDPQIQELFVKLEKQKDDKAKQKEIFDTYVKDNVPEDTVDADKSVVSALAQNAASKLAIYFVTQNSLKSSLSASLAQPILNNSNILEFQNVEKGSKAGTGTNNKQNPNYKDYLDGDANKSFKQLDNSKDNSRLVELDDNGFKTINFELDIPHLNKVIDYKADKEATAGLDTVGDYLDLSGFVRQFNNVFNWQGHNDDPNEDYKWETPQDAYDGNSDPTTVLNDNAPQATWMLWTNRSGLINRLNYIALLASLSYSFESVTDQNNLEYTYWNQLVGDPNNSYSDFKKEGDNKKPIEGILIQNLTSADNEETKYYYWVKSNISNHRNLSNFFFDYDFTSDSLDASVQPSENERLISLLNDFYTNKDLFGPKDDTSSSSGSTDTTGTNPPPNSRAVTGAKTNFDWLRSWEFSNHDLVSPYANVIDYANFFKYFQLANLDDVFGQKELEDFNNANHGEDKNQITKYNSAFTQKICYDTNQRKLADAQPMLDEYTKYNYQDDLISFPMLKMGSEIISNKADTFAKAAAPFENFMSGIATLSKPSLSNSAVGLDPWTSILIGLSIVVLLVGIIISVLYRIPGAFATITVFLTGAFSLMAYRSLYLTFSFDTAIALIAGVFISFITIVNFLSYIPRVLKEKKLNYRYGVIHALKYFVKNSIGIHVTALIIALVFLYFGQFQIQGFGAMLVLNTLMSLLLNAGVFISFISILAFGLIMYKPSLMFNQAISEKVMNIELTGFDNSEAIAWKPWYTNFVTQINFNKWWTWVIASIVGVLSILGIVLLVTNVGNNGILGNDYLGVNVINDTAIPTLQGAGVAVTNNYAEIKTSLASDPTIKQLVNSGDIQLVQDNTFISSMVISSLVNTCLIAMGFCLIWSLLWLNFINIINVFVVQLISLLTFGLLGVFQLPINLNVIIMMSLAFLMNNVMIYSNFINLKFSFKMKAGWNDQEIHDYVVQNQMSNIATYWLQYGVTIVMMLFMLLFVSRDNLAATGMLILDLIFNLGIIYVLIPYLFMGMMMAREKYIVKAVAHHRAVNHVDYDKVDEQSIEGINKHVYNLL